MTGLDQAQKRARVIRVGLAQPNVGGKDLHTRAYLSAEVLWAQTAELYSSGVELVVWPEVGFNLQTISPTTTDGYAVQHGIPVALIAGTRRGSRRQYWNSAIFIDPDGRIGDHYDKIQLLPLGEYMPGGEWFPPLYQWSQFVGHIERGDIATAEPLRWGEWRFATFLCYEAILPGFVRALLRDRGEDSAHVLVNLTNDSWFGTGHEQEQHLMLSAVRAIEHHRWLLRATSTGINAFVDATGRVVKQIEVGQRDTAVHDVPMMQCTTLYEILGDWPGWLALAIFAGSEAWRCYQSRVQVSSPRAPVAL